jgi:hypothetical protein
MSGLTEPVALRPLQPVAISSSGSKMIARLIHLQLNRIAEL